MKNTQVLEHWFYDVWNKKDFSAIETYLAADCITHGLLDEQGNEVRGREGFKKFFTHFIEAFPNINIKIDDIITEGDKVVTRCTAAMPHTGKDFQATASKIIKSEGKNFQFSGVSIAIVKNDQIQEAWNHWDFLGLYMQMGVI